MKAQDYKVGQMVVLTECGAKNDGGFIQTMQYSLDTEWNHAQMCKIEKITSGVSFDDALKGKIEMGDGGSEIEEREGEVINWYNLTDEQKSRIYVNVTLVILTDGRYIFVDSEGFEYPRYVLIDESGEEMFAKEIEQERRIREEIKAKQREEFLSSIEEGAKEAEKNADELCTMMAEGKTSSCNIKRWFSVRFPNVKVISVKNDRFYEDCAVTLDCDREALAIVNYEWDRLENLCRKPVVTTDGWGDEVRGYISLLAERYNIRNRVRFVI